MFGENVTYVRVNFSQYMNGEFEDGQARVKKGKGT